MARVTRASAAREQAAHSLHLAAREPMQLSSPPPTPGHQNGRTPKSAKADLGMPKSSAAKATPATLKSNRKRPRATVLKDEDISELPHNLGQIPSWNHSSLAAKDSSTTKKAKTSHVTVKSVSPKKENIGNLATKALGNSNTSPKKGKNNGYGLIPGQTPYPNWPHPTVEECEEVKRLLENFHGVVVPPAVIPPPSETVAGCGEVPSVLDALIRTRLSAATSGANSNRAFTGLRDRFGTLKEGIGKGSVDWNKVRLAETREVFEAIKSGGLADVKSKDIKNILQMVWEENQARRNELAISGSASGSLNEDPKEKDAEIEKADAGVLSLDHLHLFSNNDAFNALTKYPGIGPKTASCVLLFCLQRPSFAVDTHVFRLCQWLGWVPPPGDPAGLPPGGKGKFLGPNRNSTFAHCEVRVPDSLKYPLHQLFIKHGKQCPRCRAITGERSVGWGEGCVIDHLVKRTGVRKDGTSPVKASKSRKPKDKAKGRTKSKAKEVDDESSPESSELSDFDGEDD